MRRKNIDSFRVIYQIVLFFNRLFHVIFRVTFFINLSKEEISKKWNEIFQMLNRARNKIDLLSWKRYRNGFSIIRSCPGIINLTKHHAKLHAKHAHFPVVPCIISLYLSFPHAQFAFDGSLFFRILIRDEWTSRSLRDPYRPLCPFEDVCSCSYINSALMVEPFCSFKVCWSNRLSKCELTRLLNHNFE